MDVEADAIPTAQPAGTVPARPLAVVGLAIRFPGAADPEALWELMVHRRESVRPVPADRWDAAAQLDPEKQPPSVGSFLAGVDLFDPGFFGISPREAESVDPQQRLLLELAWQALEDAGVRAADVAGSRTGVYVGASWHDYETLRKNLSAPPTQHSAIGTSMDVLATRVSYFLKLTGPSLTVETGCSSALVALDLAAQALRSGDLAGALVCGVSLMLTPEQHIGMNHFGGLSATGHCHAFGAGADGYARGEGAGVLYLKTLDRALAAGDRIHGLIVGTAVNNDGGGASMASPHPAGQEDVLRRAYAAAGVHPDEVAYVEAHGTGTRVGDPIEAGAIGRVLGRTRDPARGPLPIGSVKTNIGHLEPASGLAGIVKGLLVLGHGLVPPSLHAEELNPDIPFAELNLTLTREALELPTGEPAHVGVSSFGWGGTNAHVILRAAPAAVAAADQGPDLSSEAPVLLPVSAHSGDALRERAGQIARLLEAPGARLADVAGALAWHRDHFPVRAGLAVAGRAEAVDVLGRLAAAESFDTVEDAATGRAGRVGRVAFLFPGHGSHWVGMGRELYAADPVFAAGIDRCADALAPLVDWNLRAVISGAAGDGWAGRPQTCQPVLWAMSVALAAVWRDAGLTPDVVVGHSQGEIAAATVAEALSVEDAALIVVRRSEIAGRQPGRGRMLAVGLDADAVAAALAGFEESIGVAVHNGPSSHVVSGERDAVLVLKEILELDGVFCRLVDAGYASHSPQMDGAEHELTAALAGLRPRAGTIPLLSTVRAEELAGPELDAGYWFENLRRPVLFAPAMERAFAEGVTHVVEVSAHPVLTTALDQLAAGRAAAPAVLSTLRRGEGSPLDLARAFAWAYAAGLEPFGRLPRRSAAAVPTYPWQRRRFWPATGRRRTRAAGLAVSLSPAVAEPDAWSGALELSTADSPWLDDHRVHDAVVAPGTLMLELAVRTAAARTGKAPHAVSDVAFLSNLTLGEDPAELSVRWRDEGNGGGGFTLSCLPPGATGWTTHAKARILPARAEIGAPPSFPARLLDIEPQGPDAFYAACAERGLNYGPAFQGVIRAYPGDGEALGEVRLSERCRSGPDSQTLHAALWDGALQVALLLLADARTVVPTAIHRVLAHREFDGSVRELWAHAVARGEFVFDVFGFDGERNPLFTIEGLRLAPLEQADGPDIAERVHRLVFAADPAGQQEARSRPELARAGEGWLVCADPAQAADARALVTALTSASTRAEVAEDPVAWPGLLAAGEWAGAVFLAPDARHGLDLQRGGLNALTALVRAAVSAPTVPRLAVATRGAVAADGAEAPDPGSALYWGYGRTLRREHPETESVLLDLPADLPDWAQSCAAELLGGHEDDQVLLRAGGRLTGRLVRGEDAGPRPSAAAWRTPAQPLRLGVAGAGLWEGLSWRPLSRRRPGPDQVEIEVEACGLNFIDVMKSLGVYPDAAAGADLLGGECAGRVAAVGDGVEGLAVGDRVVACAFGALASHVLARAAHTRRVPEGMASTDAAALPMVLCTAWYGLNDIAGLAAGETVLVHSAAGGLGLAALQVARVLGAEVIATAGTEEKRTHLRALGVRHVFDSRGHTWAEDVRAATGGRGVDAVLNSLAGVAIDQGLDILAEDGRFVEVGKKDVFSGRSVSLAAFAKGISFSAVDLAGLLDRRPLRFARLFGDVWDLVEQGVLGALPTTVYPFGGAVEALRALSRGSHIGKFAVRDPATAPPVKPEPLRDGRLRADATYVITGGLGALGLSLAERFARLGAGSLLLLGRSAPADEAAARIEALRSGGTPVRTAQVDVADRAALDAVLDRARRDLPPLRGVVHAAGLLDDATILTMTPRQLERVLAPKIDGARHLDEATAADRLDMFVLFSSAAALLGSPGQAAYCAANAYLDALAESRRARGLPGLSVQWGPFLDIGLAAAHEARGARLAGHGMDGFAADEAWDALGHFLGRDRPVVSYVPIDLRRWFDAYPDTAALACWGPLREAARAGNGRAAQDGALTARLRSADRAERRSLLEAAVRAVAGQVLRLDPGLIEGEAPFKSLGLDSLMGLELRNRLEAALGLALSPTLLWTYGNILALSGRLAEQFAESDDAARQPQEALR